MTHEYNYELVEGHIILEDNGRSFLLDTGSPVSFCDAAPLLFANREFDVLSEHGGVTVAKLREWAKTRLDGLLGADILNKFDLMVDPEGKRVLLSEDRCPLTGACLKQSFLRASRLLRRQLARNMFGCSLIRARSSLILTRKSARIACRMGRNVISIPVRVSLPRLSGLCLLLLEAVKLNCRRGFYRSR